jgi:homoserine dehydrogenase
VPSASKKPQAAPTVRVALLGCGNVGSALAEILLTRQEEIAARTGIHLELVGIAVANANKARSDVIPPALIGTRPTSSSSRPCARASPW